MTLRNNCAFMHIHCTVALIGMESASIVETESDLSLNVCVQLINLIQLDIPLTAFIDTQSGTATGKISSYSLLASISVTFCV